jgi:hypothetical protein
MKIFLTPDDASITLKSTKIDLPSLIEQAGHQCVIKSPYSLTIEEIDAIIPQVQTNYELYLDASYNISLLGLPQIQLLDKSIANQTLEKLGLNYLNTKVVTCREDIETFSDDTVILKPKVGTNSKSEYAFAYVVMPKTQLLSEIDNSDINFGTNSYLIQEGVTNSRPIIWIGGYVNPQGEIHIDGILDQHFSINDKYFEDKLRHPLRHNMLVEEIPLPEMNEFHAESIRQIKIVLKHVEAKCTPFCIQCIVDDDNEVQILDINLGFGKAYALRIREKTPQYIIDRIKYTYGGADSIPPNDTFFMNYIAQTPNGITDEIKEYIKDRSMYVAMGTPDKDYVLGDPENPVYVYYRYESRFSFIGSSKQEVLNEIENFKTFLSTLNS